MLLFSFFDLLFLIPLFIIGGVCSYTDIRYGKIFNKWIVRGFFWGIILYIFLFFYNYFFLFQLSNIKYLIEVGVNALISFFVGYLLWHLKLWSAGDAKFFALCAFLLPLKFYSKSYLPHFPSFNLLVNLFIPLLFLLTLRAISVEIGELFSRRKSLKNLKKLNLKNLFLKAKVLVKMFFPLFLDYTFIFILFQQTSSFKKYIPGADFLFNPFFLFSSMFFVAGYLNKIKKQKKWISSLINITVLLYYLYLIFFGRFEILKMILRNTLIFMVVITLFRQVLNFYIEKKEIRKIRIKNLKKGMMPSREETSFILKKLNYREMGKSFGEIEAEGLNQDQITIIKNLFADKPNFEIKVYKTFSFAPFMLLAVIVSIFTEGSLIDYFVLNL